MNNGADHGTARGRTQDARRIQRRSNRGAAGERAFLQWVQGRSTERADIVVPSGDDCAVVRLAGHLLLIKIDTVVEGVHFSSGTPWRLVGRLAMARALSDIAAMGGIPKFAVVGLVIRRSMSMAEAKALERGIETFGVPIVGGDTKAHRGPCIASVSLLGEMRGARPVLRRGARPGDILMVTGKIGNSLAGHYLKFRPRLAEGRIFATKLRVNAMIDISDGLAIDLSRFGVGADLREAAIPHRDALEQALYAGDDYELLVAASPAVAAAIEKKKLAIPIGAVSADPGIRLHRRNGRIEKIEPRGYEHRFGTARKVPR